MFKAVYHPDFALDKAKLDQGQKRELFRMIGKLMENPYIGTRMKTLYPAASASYMQYASTRTPLKIGYEIVETCVVVKVVAAHIEPDGMLIKTMLERLA